MATLLVLSVWSVSIMIDRRRIFKRLFRDNDFLELRELIIKHSRQEILNKLSTNTSLRARAVEAFLHVDGTDVTKVDRALKSYLSERRAELEKGFTVLATLGSNAPFIGLFGTVLGIIQAFGVLSSQTGEGTGNVIGGISEALVATTIGLVVAIPTMIAYNYFTRQLKLILTECETLKDLYVARGNTK
jgi:biopolymer transport protein ExbB/TolQ